MTESAGDGFAKHITLHGLPVPPELAEALQLPGIGRATGIHVPRPGDVRAFYGENTEEPQRVNWIPVAKFGTEWRPMGKDRRPETEESCVIVRKAKPGGGWSVAIAYRTQGGAWAADAGVRPASYYEEWAPVPS